MSYLQGLTASFSNKTGSAEELKFSLYKDLLSGINDLEGFDIPKDVRVFDASRDALAYLVEYTERYNPAEWKERVDGHISVVKAGSENPIGVTHYLDRAIRSLYLRTLDEKIDEDQGKADSWRAKKEMYVYFKDKNDQLMDEGKKVSFAGIDHYEVLPDWYLKPQS